MSEQHVIAKRRKRFLSEVKTRHERHVRYEKDRDSSFWTSVGMMGAIGWTVAVPTALGVLFGRWLDGRLGSGYVFMVFFMLLGLGMGCVTAWRMVAERL